MYTEEELKKLRVYLRDENPLGPRDGNSIENQEVARILFETDNQIYREITRRPSIVVGRRGSGKTSFLMHLKNYQYFGHVVVDVTLSDAIQNIENFVSSSPNARLPVVESVANLWDWLFWIALLLKVKEQYATSYEKQNKEQPIGDNISQRFSEFQFSTLANLANKFSSTDAHGSETSSIASAILHSTPGFTSKRLEIIKKNVKRTLQIANAKAIILVDSLEQYSLGDPISDRVLSGLLKSAGRFNAIFGRPEIRLCLPSELYFYFRKISSNTTKDFEYDIKLHWHPRELLNLTAGRYLAFLLCNKNRVDQTLLTKLVDYKNSAAKRQWGLLFWNEILPDTITNRYGVEENSIAYIMRHTHLLPRQLIVYFNKILWLNIKKGKSLTKVDAEILTIALTSVESDVWEEVCNAYKPTYPDAVEICTAAIPHLPLVFERGKLDVVFRENIKPIFHKLEDKDMDSYKFERMMVEMGCVGVVRPDKDGARYIEADFEYNNNSQLSTHTKSRYCLHPMFCSLKAPPEHDNETKVILPFGSEPDSVDYRAL